MHALAVHACKWLTTVVACTGTSMAVQTVSYPSALPWACLIGAAKLNG